MSIIAFAEVQTARAGYLSLISARVERWLEAEAAQLPLWLPVALGYGIALWFTLPDLQAWKAAVVLALGCGSAGLFAGKRLGRLFFCGGLFVAMGIGVAWLRCEDVAASRLDRPRVASFTARVEGVEHLGGRGFDRLSLRPDAAEGLPALVRVNLRGDAPAGFLPGALVRVKARLMPPAAPGVPGGYDFARAAWFKRLGATGKVLDEPVLLRPAPPPSGFQAKLAALRARLTRTLQRGVGGSAGGIAAALVTGDQGGVGQMDAEALRTAGLAHLLSISGLHVAAVIAAAVLLTRRSLGLVPWLALRLPLSAIAAGVGALAGLGYTLLSGAEVPTVRTCLAALLVLLGFVLGREAFSMRLLAAAAFAILLFRPEALVGPSFQLSFAAVATIIALHEYPGLRERLAPRDEGIVRRTGRAVLGLLVTGLAVELALAPIAIFHFNRTGVYGALANIVAIPFTTFVIMPLELVALLMDAGGIGAPGLWLLRQALLILIGLSRTVSAWPGAALLFPAIGGTAYGLMIAGGLWICLWRTKWRFLGLIPLGIGAGIALAVPKPDLLISGDGRHMALNDGGMMLLRPRAGDYTREMFASAAAFDGDALALDDRRDARCSADACLVRLWRDGRQWTILATRSPLLIARDRFQPACARADIVVSDRKLPPWCRPLWLRLDRTALRRSGAVAIDLSRQRVDSVAARSGNHPWSIVQ